MGGMRLTADQSVRFIAYLLLLSSVLFILFRAQGARERVVFGDAEQTGFSLVYIADEMGYFEDERLDVEYKKFAFGKDALADLVAGGVDMVAAFETPVVHSIYRGENVRILSTLHVSNRNTRLAALDGGRIRTPHDLRGKRVGVVEGTNMEYFLYEFLANHGIGTDEVDIVDIGGNDIARMLAEKELDAGVVWNTAPKTLEERVGAKTRAFYSSTYVELSVLLTRSDFELERPGSVKRFMRALRRAEDLYENDPAAALAAVKRRYEKLYPDGKKATDAESVWDTMTLDMKLSNVLVQALAAEGSFFRRTGAYSGTVPDFSANITSDHLRGINPRAVTVL